MKGMMVSVYRSQDLGHCTNGPTGYANRVLLVGEGIPELFDTQLEEGPVFVLVFRLVKRIVCGKEHLCAVPVKQGRGNYCFGGNFLYVSEGRFPFLYPIPAHDHCEQNDYGVD
jgi:hypothetical protein